MYAPLLSLYRNGSLWHIAFIVFSVGIYVKLGIYFHSVKQWFKEVSNIMSE